MNGNLKNCPACGKLFLAQPKQRLCADCFEKQREEEERIIRYVNAHPEVTTLDEIAAGTGAEGDPAHDSRLPPPAGGHGDPLSVRELRHADHARTLLRGLHARLQGRGGSHRLSAGRRSAFAPLFAETSHGGKLKLKESFSDTTHERRVCE